MIKIEDDGLFKIFPSIETISQTFEYQNILLNKIVLTGKINALDIAENLFNFTEQTAQTFAVLQTKLIESLLEENKKELLDKAKLKSQIAINRLNNILFERTIDVEFLAQDNSIIEMLKGKMSKEIVVSRLQDFIDKYSMYNEVIIVDKMGHIKANANNINKFRFTKDEIIQQALESEEIVFDYRKTDLFSKQRKSFFFAKSLKDENGNLGVLIVFFKFEDEIQAIFNNLIEGKESITILDKYNNIWASSEKGIDKKSIQRAKINTFVINDGKFYVRAKAVKNDNDFDCGLSSVISYGRTADINPVAEFDNDKEAQTELVQINLKNKDLQKLADEGYEILEDLSDVIINGELIAAKSKQYILIPILDNLREVSFKVVKLIEISIDRLQKSIDQSLINSVKIVSKLIINAVERVLYERGNDIRWWSMNCDIKSELAKDNPNIEKLSVELSKINQMYPMYSNIFIFNKNKEIIASANSSNVGDLVTNNWTSTNKDSNKYFVSAFETTPFYNNKPTYIYYASVIENGEIVGGIGGVFDSSVQFANILHSSFGAINNGFALLVDNKGYIISSTNEKYQILTLLNFFDKVEDGFVGDMVIDEVAYKVSVSRSVGYREYQNKQLFSIVCMEK